MTENALPSSQSQGTVGQAQTTTQNTMNQADENVCTQNATSIASCIRSRSRSTARAAIVGLMTTSASSALIGSHNPNDATGGFCIPDQGYPPQALYALDNTHATQAAMKEALYALDNN